MNDENPLRTLTQRWAADDLARDKQEEHAQRMFLEQEANHTFAPIEDFLTRLAIVLGAAGASVEINSTWEHLEDQGLRRVAKVICSKPPRELRLDFTVRGVSIFYRDRTYRFTGGIGALIPAITADVEQFLTPHRASSPRGSVPPAA
jgi:hypothetical protein